MTWSVTPISGLTLAVGTPKFGRRAARAESQREWRGIILAIMRNRQDMHVYYSENTSMLTSSTRLLPLVHWMFLDFRGQHPQCKGDMPQSSGLVQLTRPRVLHQVVKSIVRCTESCRKSGHCSATRRLRRFANTNGLTLTDLVV